MHVKMDDNGNVNMDAYGDNAVSRQAEILQAHIRAKTIEKLGLYLLAALLMIAAALMVVFAPNGREATSGIIAFALVLVAGGAAGYGKFSVKVPGISADANK
jgi:hypothetical protein